MKSLIRIPTTQYGYLEFEFEGTPEEAITEHNRILQLYAGGSGISEKEFSAAVDLYLSKQEGNTETYMAMSLEQQKWFQITKRAFKRLAYDNANETNVS